MAGAAVAQGSGTSAAAAPQATGQAPPIPVAPAQTTQPGTPQIIIPPPYRNDRNEIPEEVIPIVGIVMGTGMAIALGYPVVRTITRLIERATDKRYVRGQDVEVQLRALQESVDTMAIEIERISESQRFQSKLLSDRKNEALGSG